MAVTKRSSTRQTAGAVDDKSSRKTTKRPAVREPSVESSDDSGSGSDSDSDSDPDSDSDSDAGAVIAGANADPDSDTDPEDVEQKQSEPVAVVSRVRSRIQQARSAAKTQSEQSQQQQERQLQLHQGPGSAPLTVKPDGATTFADLGLDPWLVHALSTLQINRPTGIQRTSIPEVLRGRNCIGGSRTGSGKTVAFMAPILHHWARDPSAIFGLVLTPTRELAFQIFEQVAALSAVVDLKPVLVTGGADMCAQAIELAKRPHIVVATPGRLADHIKSSGRDTVVGLTRCRFLVLDEADRLLEPGRGSMVPDVETCLDALSPAVERQTLLFTATVTDPVRALKDMPSRPGKPPTFFCEIDTDSLATPETLRQMYLMAPVTHRECYLHVLMSTPANEGKATIVFCNRTATATVVEYMLRLLGHRVTAVHSGLAQSVRAGNLAKFRAKVARVLVATDVVARGLDIPEVGLVINYDVPRNPDDYIHRVGRTARAGRSGDAVTMVGQRDVDLVLAIEGRVGKKMVEYVEEGVNVETRVVKEALKPVTEAKREAALRIAEGKDVTGRRTGRHKKARV